MSTKLWGTICSGDIAIQSYSHADLDGSMKVLRESFFVNEQACIGAEINLPESEQARIDLELLCREVLKDGVSLIARHTRTNKIVSVAFNKIQIKCDSSEKSFFELFNDNICKSKSSKSLIEFMIVMDSKCNLFDKYQTDCILEIMFLATLPSFERRGIGRALCQYSIDLAKELKMGKIIETVPVNLHNKKPQIISAICTSIFSQKITMALEFEQIVEIPHTQFIFNCKTYAERTGNQHPSSILVAKRID